MGQRRDRRWTEDVRLVDGEGNVVGADRDQARNAFLELEAICAREGGAITVMPIRVEVLPRPGSLTGEAEYVNLGYIFEHHFAPTAGRVAAPPRQNGQRQPGPTFPQAVEAARQDVAPGLDPEADLVYEDEDLRDQDEAAVAHALAEGEEPSAVMPQAIDPADQHTAPRGSDLPEPAPVDPSQLVPETR